MIEIIIFYWYLVSEFVTLAYVAFGIIKDKQAAEKKQKESNDDQDLEDDNKIVEKKTTKDPETLKEKMSFKSLPTKRIENYM